MLASQFIVLQAIVQSSLFIYQPPDVREVFICFDSNGTRNDSWPSRWGRMMPYTNNTVPTLTYLIPNNSTVYKLRLRRSNFWDDSHWLDLYNKCPTPTTTIKLYNNCPTPTIANNTNTSPEKEFEPVHVVIWYTAICCSVLLLEVIVKSAKEIWKLW